MTEPPSRPEAEPLIPIAEASRLLAIPMPTLRSWELRYDIPGGSRELGRHRRYTNQELHALRLMRDEIARGRRAGAAAQTVRSLLGRTGPDGELIDQALAASERRDPASLHGHLDHSLAVLGLGGALDDVLMPFMRRIGIWWQTGRCDIETERLATETVRAWLDNLAASAPPPRLAATVVLACGPADIHTVGLEALAVLLRYEGIRCRVLGARTGVPALLAGLEATGAPTAVIVSHLPSGRRRAVEAIRVAHQRGVTVFYAGNGFTSPRNRRAVPGTYLGASLDAAKNLVASSLPV